ncbi:MAG: F0F1 ATP synthase subunit delta [Pseudomonadota bacterium]
MAGDATTFARPYAEAIFAQAQQTGQTDSWSAMLDLLATLLADAQLKKVLANPGLMQIQKADLILSIADDHLTQEGKNLVRLLAQNTRLALLPEIQTLFRYYRSVEQGTISIHLTTAYALTSADQNQLTKSLQRRLKRSVELRSEVNPELIGGFHLRAGDLVIDGSVTGQLQQLAHALN